MKKIFAIMFSLILFSAYSVPAITHASELATYVEPVEGILLENIENNVDYNVDYSKFDNYISIKNNQYTLNLPQGHSFSNYEILAVEKKLVESNALIFDTDIVIDEDTKSANIVIDGKEVRGEGKNYFKITWSYIEFGLSKTALKGGITAAVSAIAGNIASYFSFGTLTTLVSRVVGGMFGATVASKITHGIWVQAKYNAVLASYGKQ